MGKRAGSDAAAQLLASDKLEGWLQALASYDRAVARLSQEKGKTGLAELDRWWREELPSAIRSRGSDPYVTKEELVKVVQWKLWVGTMRPNLLRFAKEADPAQVKAKSREAFRCLPRTTPSKGRAVTIPGGALREAVGALSSQLRGVGPATASAVLAAGCWGCPFDADEVIDAVVKTGARKYTVAEYLKVHETLSSKASRLGTPWDAERVRKALWAHAMCSRFDLKPEDHGASPEPSPEPSAGSTGKERSKRTTRRGGRDAPEKRKSKDTADHCPEVPSRNKGLEAPGAKRRKRS